MKNSQLSIAQLFYLALAECRGAWRRFVFFIICLAIGVGAVMTVKSFSLLVENSVRRESKSLLAGDLEISGSWALEKQDVDFLKARLPAGAEFLFVKELHAMAQFDREPPGTRRPGQPAPGRSLADEAPSSLLVELKAVPDSPPLYPFYGALTAQPGGGLPALLADRGALVEPSFLSRSRLKVGDVFKLGSIQARIAGEIAAEPDRITRAFSIGPRVMVSLKTLEDAGLVQPGSRVKHRTLIRLPESAPLAKTKALVEDNLNDTAANVPLDPASSAQMANERRRGQPEPGHPAPGRSPANVRSYKDMQNSLTHSIERMGQYLGSLGVIALLRGGIGVAMIVRAFMSQKLDTIAILNCLGAESRTIFKIYLLQSLLLGLAGSALGIGLGYGLQYLLPSKLPGLLNISARPEFYWRPALQALLLGLTTTLLFAVWPLVRAVKTRPLRLFRHVAEEEELARGSRRERWTSGFLFSLGLVLIVFWQAGSMRRGLVFLAALVVSAAVLSGMSVLALKVLRRLPPSPHMTRRYGLANLFRPNNQASSIITALGMGIMLALTVRLAQMDMVAMLNENAEIKPTNYFFIDIQGDQKYKLLAELKRIAPES
ncbi:MAG: FtsX-like permease family protein, partial [Nitrospinae bacterium]|nr:FtsX-like permease family protein [Nitrospinota bacterium]